MVSLQFWKRKVEEPISQVLKQLQADINTHEIQVSALRTRQRSITGQITLYSVLIYLAYVVYYALGKNYELEGQTILTWTLKIAAMLVFPVLVYGMRMAVRWWYTRRIDQHIQEKETLKTRLAEKIEELKEKSDYYNTQQLLQRYDPKALPKSSSLDKLAQQQQPKPAPGLPHKPSQDDLRQQTLRQRGISLPPLPPVITPSTFTNQLPSAPPPQNIPQFHPSAFSPPPSPTLPAEPESKTFLDRVLDLLVGVDENSPEQRYALICRYCRAHNGLAPPGEQPQNVGYLCGRCGGWNGPDPNKKKDAVIEEKAGEENKEEGEGAIVPPVVVEDVAQEKSGE